MGLGAPALVESVQVCAGRTLKPFYDSTKGGKKGFDGDAVIPTGCFPKLLFQTGCRRQIHFHPLTLLGVTQDQ